MPNVDWQPQIGDPTFAGWFTVFSYFLAAWLSYRTRLISHAPAYARKKQKLFWWIICLICLLLGMNKQLDLQSLLTAAGKYYAHTQGWYKYRQSVQIAFILTILAAGLGSLLWGIRYFKGIYRRNWLAFVGVVFLITFVLIRASSFHHMDRLIGYRLMGLKLNWILELTGIYCIALNALWLIFSKRKFA